MERQLPLPPLTGEVVPLGQVNDPTFQKRFWEKALPFGLLLGGGISCKRNDCHDL